MTGGVTTGDSRLSMNDALSADSFRAAVVWNIVDAPSLPDTTDCDDMNPSDRTPERSD